MTGLGMRERDALLAAIRRATLVMKAATAEGAFEMAMERVGRLLHERRLERRYNPNWPSQPRVPRGNPDGGQWTDGGASGGEVLEPSEFEEAVSGEPTRRKRPLRSAPRIPKLRPDNSRYRNDIIKDVARWARILWRTGGPLGAFLGFTRTSPILKKGSTSTISWNKVPRGRTKSQSGESNRGKTRFGFRL